MSSSGPRLGIPKLLVIASMRPHPAPAPRPPARESFALGPGAVRPDWSSAGRRPSAGVASPLVFLVPSAAPLAQLFEEPDSCMPENMGAVAMAQGESSRVKSGCWQAGPDACGHVERTAVGKL